PRGASGGDGGEIEGVPHGFQDLSLQPGGECQDHLWWQRDMHPGKSHFLALKGTDLSRETGQITVKGPGDRPIQPLLNEWDADRWSRSIHQWRGFGPPHEVFIHLRRDAVDET